ncbi:MAG: hypothetical protein LBE13_22505, partial [Bacteroidales bacterium]|nr:hypothetical protein [Bacteroidales bacterium]
PFGVRKNNLDWETALIYRCLSLIAINASLGFYAAITLNFRHFFSHYDNFVYAFEPISGHTTFFFFFFTPSSNWYCLRTLVQNQF